MLTVMVMVLCLVGLDKKASFTATGDTYTYTDDKSFQSDSATYYRVLKAADVVEA